jgi:hypothetical protein
VESKWDVDDKVSLSDVDLTTPREFSFLYILLIFVGAYIARYFTYLASKMTDPLKTLDTAPPSKSSNPPSVSQKKYPIAGILTTVFGLDELPSQASEIACLWLLHPRLATQERMTGIAESVIADWNQRIKDGHAGPVKGLIAVSFDQRNHGTRLVDPLANEAWRQGNPRHAQDMFSIFREYYRISSPSEIICSTEFVV